MLKFCLRLIINLCKLLLLCIPLQIIGLVILPIGIKIAQNRENKQKDTDRDYKLSKYIRFFDNADLYIDRDKSTYISIANEGFWSRYYWLAIRNPLNYFGYLYLGHQVQSHLDDKTNGNFAVGDTKDKCPGLLYNELDNIYEYYYIKKWSENKCLRFRMGWKISQPILNPQGSYIQWVMVIQPYKDYAGS